MSDLHVLVGVDGSAQETKVLAAAIREAQLRGARLHLCRAVTIPVSVPIAAWTLGGDELLAYLTDHARRELQVLASGIPAGLTAAPEIRIGTPADVLCALASELRCELLVVGTGAVGHLARWLGSTAHRIVAHAPCDVLVVRG